MPPINKVKMEINIKLYNYNAGQVGIDGDKSPLSKPKMTPKRYPEQYDNMCNIPSNKNMCIFDSIPHGMIPMS